MTDVLKTGTETCAGAGDDERSESYTGYIPVPRGRSAGSAVRRARERLEEDLRYLAEIEHELSASPGTRPERHPDFWLGLLRGTASYLLWTLREQDKVIHGQG